MDACSARRTAVGSFRWLLLLFAILWGVAAAAQSEATQIGNATVSGSVRDANRALLAGATITATNNASGASVTSVTDAGGTYSLVLPAGVYRIVASAHDQAGPVRTLEVVAGGRVEADFTLGPVFHEVVTVTATKREADPSAVPFSVVALSEEDLRDRGAENLEGVAANVGSFTVQNLGPGQSQVAMRGVSAGQIARDQPGVKEQVGIYLDETPVSLSLFTPDLDLVDMNRVEVLRGPQGTLYGAGSVTGTVRYVSRQPALNVTEGFVELSGAAVDTEGAGDLKAAVNVPLGEKIAARFVGYYNQLAGSIDAVQPDLSVDENVNEGSRSGGRVALAFVPNAKLTITPRVLYQKSDWDGWNLSEVYNILANPFTTTRPAVTFQERQEFTQTAESFRDDFTLADVDVRYDFGGVTLASITSFVDREIRVVRDTTALTASFTGATAGFPEPIYTLDSPLYDDTDATMWSQELRLSGERPRLQWVAGLFYSDMDRAYGQNVTVPGFEDATGVPTEGALAPKDSIYYSQFDYDQKQLALFGEGTLSVSDRFDVTAGLRWYDYDESKAQLVDGAFAGNPAFPTGVLSLPGETEASGVAPRLILAYKLTGGGLFDAQASKGFRLGGINDPLNVPLCTPEDLVTFGGHGTWEDETVWNYEAGYKSKRMRGNTTVNASVFYIDISGLQTTVTAGTCTSRLIFNVPKARSQGLEIDFASTPLRGLDISVSASYNDAELRSTLTSTDSSGAVSVVSGIAAGRRLPSVPIVQAALSARYQFDIGTRSQIYVVAAYQHIGSRFTQVGDEDLGTLDMTAPPLFNTIGGPLTQTTFEYDPKLPAYDVLNLRLGLLHGAWDVAAYVNNVTDELAYLALERERGTLARIGYLTNQPRTVVVATRFVF